MKNSSWRDSLAKIDKNIVELKSMTKMVTKLEKTSKKYGSNVNLSRRMTLTNFDELINQQEGGKTPPAKGTRASNLTMIPENATGE